MQVRWVLFDCFNLPAEMRGGPRSCATLIKDQKVVFGVENGLLVFNPNNLEKDSIVPKVVLTDFRVFNESKNLGQASELLESITLPYQDNILSFGFSALHFHHIEGVNYKYMLEGFDKKWKELSDKEQRVTYTNLSPRTYTFKAIAGNADGFWTKEEDGLSILLTILPPWYRSWWAYLSYIVAIGIVFLGIRRYELRRKLAQAEALHFKELDLVKSRLYTNITHEFRTPLTIILGMAAQVKSDPKNWFNEGLQLINRNGKQLLNLVNQLLDLSKLESGKMPLKLINSDIVSFLQYLTESFHSYADSKDIRLHFMSGLDELLMDYDPEKLQNVVSNLISNAIKFTPAGGDVYIGLAVSNGPQEVSNDGRRKKRSASNCLLLTIKDTGIGIAAENLPHIFERFYQVDASPTRRSEGTGIGLALTRELVRALGGSIEVESKMEKGTKFTISLPITQTAKNFQPEKGSKLPPTLGDALLLDRESQDRTAGITQRNQHLVLLVEDNEDVLTYLSSFLSNDYHIATAANGQEGIDKALELIPDLIVSDVMMPEKDGFEVCAALKEAERTSHIPIILLTAKSDQTSKLDGLKQGADAYLSKPFNKEELLVRIEKLIALRLQLQARFQKAGSLRQALNHSVPTKEAAFLQKVIQVIEKNLKDENFGMPQLCKELHLSRSHLFRKLKALTGKSATHLIRSMRLEKGKELLETTHLNVSEVCFEVGFNSVAYFSRAFQGEFGSPPSSFQKT